MASSEIYAERQEKYGTFSDNLALYSKIRFSVVFINKEAYSKEVQNGVELIFQLLSLKTFRFIYAGGDKDSLFDFINYLFMLQEIGISSDDIKFDISWHPSVRNFYKKSKKDLEKELDYIWKEDI